jgi:hypothetical protein
VNILRHPILIAPLAKQAYNIDKPKHKKNIMSDTSAAEFTFNDLSLSRRAYAATIRRAAAIWSLFTELRACPVVVTREAAINAVAEKVYYSNRYDACERYETIEDFKESLKEDLDEHLYATSADATHYTLRPFFAGLDEPAYLFELGLSYLKGCNYSDLTGLDVTAKLGLADLLEKSSVAAAPSTSSEAGIPEEVEILVRHYRSETIRLVNLMRHMATALRYIRSALTEPERIAKLYVTAEKDPAIEPLVTALERAVALPFEPAPCSHFGTEADRVNPLRRLTADMETALLALEH